MLESEQLTAGPQPEPGFANRLLYQLSYVGFWFAFSRLPNRLSFLAVQVVCRADLYPIVAERHVNHKKQEACTTEKLPSQVVYSMRVVFSRGGFNRTRLTQTRNERLQQPGRLFGHLLWNLVSAG